MNRDIRVKDLKTNIEPFNPTSEYLDSMPDLQNGEFDDIPIDFVGIHGFHLPLQIRQKDGNTQEALVTITGTVSLTAHERGINMSRIIRTMYGHKDDVFDINKIEEVLRDYQRDLKTFDAHMLFNYKYRIWQDALVTTKENGEKEYQDIKKDVMAELKKEFKPEFLNRIDEIIVFHKLEDNQIRKIVDIMIDNVGKLLKEQGIKLTVDENAKDLVAKKGTDKTYGARPLKRAIQTMVEDKIAEAMLDGKIKKEAKVTVQDDEIVVG